MKGNESILSLFIFKVSFGLVSPLVILICSSIIGQGKV